jgi:spore maturation protein CgeB
MRILISGTCPPQLNSNYGLLRELTQGFAQLEAMGKAVEAQLVGLADLLPAIENWRPQVVLLVGGLALETIPLALVSHRCQQQHSLLAFWSLEDPYELDHVLRQGHWFHLICTTDFASSCFYPGHWPVRHLPLASPDRPSLPLNQRLERSEPWLFCGVPFPNRLDWIASLRQASPAGLLIGPGWPHYPAPTRQSGARIPAAVLRALYATMPLTLYLGRNDNLANNAGVMPSTPGPRLFECAGSGGRQLVCGAGLEAGHYYEPQREMLTAETPEQAIDLIERAAAEPAAMAAMGERAWQRTQAEHLYRHRAEQLVSWLREL